MRHWLLVLVYIVPIIGALTSMIRRASALYSFGESFRRLLPDDRFYRMTRRWQGWLRQWLQKYSARKYINVEDLNLLAGKLEYALGHTRDYTIGLYMVGVAVFETTLMICGNEALFGVRFTSVFYHTFFALLSIFSYRRHVLTGLQLSEFLRSNPKVHPQEFFDHYYRRLGPQTVPFPRKAACTVDPHDVSFLTGRPPQQGIRFLLRGLYDTAVLARTAYKASDYVGYEYGREIFERMSQMWGKRILQLFRCRLIVKGDEKIKELSGKVILIFNHKSHLDFVFNFFAMSGTALRVVHPEVGEQQYRGVRPRYMAAKDHFVDNRFVYDGLGIGRLIESVDMVFVDRKGKGRLAVFEACEKLLTKEIEIALYPQGTRAYGNRGSRGERRDAGFYTTGSPSSLKQTLGHLKKGAAYLAVDTAIQAAPQNTAVHLVMIGIDGTGNIVPKGSFEVQTEATVTFTVGEVFTLTPERVARLEKPEGMAQTEGEHRYLGLIDEIQQAINQGLVQALHLHEKLEARFVEDLKEGQLIPMEGLFNVKRNLSEIAFVILDRIYALSPSEWGPFLAELAGQLARGASSVILEELRDRVTERLITTRGKECKPMVIQERVVPPKKRAVGGL
ncbi:MAG: 1-acyl-sn-glycerol-3-phosphate acyltransferase [Deltaproteobacteria bacterium]|nr:1-acyl-sn-glycerol-3-phosphate acyltransferase [Deltaproteobacteria bacterium]